MKTKDGTTVVLTFEDVCFAPETEKVGALDGVTFSVAAGKLMLILSDEEGTLDPLCDLAEGLVWPDSGMVAFQGVDWARMPADDQVSTRGRIGRVFASQGWVSNLGLYDNVTLAQRHHTVRSEDEIRRAAMRLGLALGLQAIPDLPPDTMPADVLKKAECVRAFLGRPALVLLEGPENGMDREATKALVSIVNSAVAGGVSVVWMTKSAAVYRDTSLENPSRYTLKSGKIRSESEG
ncbi:MAG: organic solvent ABC transporter ATP-binding protein [Verrucomicrobia bacterium]|nr:organic solvent ABC transporter ATP-binding protein [Verrucomicrobiota bacterium]